MKSGVVLWLPCSCSFNCCIRRVSKFVLFSTKQTICWQLIRDIAFCKLRCKALDMLDSGDPGEDSARRRWIFCRKGKRASKHLPESARFESWAKSSSRISFSPQWNRAESPCRSFVANKAGNNKAGSARTISGAQALSDFMAARCFLSGFTRPVCWPRRILSTEH